jgi:hypothetical protein
LSGEPLHRSKTDRRSFLKLAGASALVSSAPLAFPSAEPAFPDLGQLQRRQRQAGIVSPERTYRAMEWEFHTPAQQTFDIHVEGAMPVRKR